MKKLLIASAIGMAFAGQAQALTAASTSNGSLFLAVWDNTDTGTYSYVQDLGYTINGFLPNGNAAVSSLDGGPVSGTMTPDAGLNLSFNTSFLSSYTGSLTNLSWAVVGYDSSSVSLQQNTRRLVTTTQVGTTTAGNITNSGLNSITTNVGTVSGNFAPACSTAGCSTFSIDNYLLTNLTDTLNKGVTTGLSASQVIGGALEMMYITQNGTNPGSTSLQAGYDFFDNAYGRAVWSLSSTGQLTYSIEGAPAAVPVPAAVWLFGSGLLGLVGIGRRKSQAA
jgi:hypothetical protein